MREEIGISEAARRFKVSVSTLKRMCDEGLVPIIEPAAAIGVLIKPK